MVQQLRDAEVEQLRRAVGRDKNVRGLEVAMDDQILVRVLDGGAEIDEELQPLAQVELPLVAVLIERLAFDVLHYQVRLAVLRLARIDQSRDVRDD